MRSACRYRGVWGACLGLVLLMSATGFAQNAAAQPGGGGDEAKIRELDAKWSETASANDVDGTVSYYTDDASLLPPNAPMASGKQAIRATWVALLTPGNRLAWEAKKVEVARSGDMAYLIGTYQLTMKGAQDRGKFVEVWKKQPDGQWKVAVDIFNSDLPAAGAPK
jgi:uncharacterized protein (TIGR02246 family)